MGVKRLKTYYCVTSAFYDDGTVRAAITDRKEANAAPQNTYYSASNRDIYVDWYANYNDAVQAVENAKKA